MARITNKHGLPAPLVESVTARPYDSGGSYITATGLLTPPLIRKLRSLHDDEIEEDAIDLIWSLLGSAGHNILENCTNTGFSEERMFAQIAGKKVSGQFDHLSCRDGDLIDYKFTSVWAVIFGKDEWEAQLNILHWLLYVNGIDAERLFICAILKDWDKNKARQDPNYPQKQVEMVEYPIWPLEEQEQFIARKLAMSIAADEDIVSVCTDDERWKKPDSWAVKKKNQKKAVRVFDNEEDALSRADHENKNSKGQFYVEHRPGSYNRCEGYCPVRKFCPEYV